MQDVNVGNVTSTNGETGYKRPTGKKACMKISLFYFVFNILKNVVRKTWTV